MWTSVQDFLQLAYPWMKVMHLLSIISWMAALLYLPRLFVNHAGLVPGSEASEALKGMEYRLYTYIMTPAMWASLLFGVLLILTPGIVDWGMGWFHVKLTALLALFAFHGFCKRWLRAFAQDRNSHTGRFFRYMNEVPTLLMIIIVIMVVVKPF